MKPVFQTTFGEGKGNCLSASLASLLELSIEDVPNFASFGNRFWPEFWEWMKANNLVKFSFGPDHKPNGYHLITVKSPRGDFYHSLVGLNGEPVHDPYPGGDCQHNGIVSFDVIYPFDISKPVCRGNKEAD